MKTHTKVSLVATAALVGVCAFALCGCGSSTEQPWSRGEQATASVASQATEAASVDGVKVLTKGNMLFVQFASDSHEGYDWNNKVEGTGLGEVGEGDPIEENVVAIEGWEADSWTLITGRGNSDLGGVRTMVFEGNGAGESKVILTYQRMRETTDDDRVVVLNVTTGDDGSISSVTAEEASRTDDEFASSAVNNTVDNKDYLHDSIITNKTSKKDYKH